MKLEMLFSTLKARNEGAHMAHVYYGDPCEAFSIKLIETLAENGADIIEFGIPFSDPIADGATFQAACERALNAGITPAKCFEGVKKLRARGLKAPIIMTTYFNIPYAYGLKAFVEKAREADVQGILVPDLPIEEAEPMLHLTRKNGLHLILQAAPTTSLDRLKRIAAEASGFIYLIGLEGVTGSRLRRRDVTVELIDRVKAAARIPVMVGFGISRREHAEAIISAGADGVVVGSAYARIYAANINNPFEQLPQIASLAKEIKMGCLAKPYRQKADTH